MITIWRLTYPDDIPEQSQKFICDAFLYRKMELFFVRTLPPSKEHILNSVKSRIAEYTDLPSSAEWAGNMLSHMEAYLPDDIGDIGMWTYPDSAMLSTHISPSPEFSLRATLERIETYD